jgi:hypothetical protein
MDCALKHSAVLVDYGDGRMFALLALLNILSAGLLIGAMMEVAVADIPMFLELSPETFVTVFDGIGKRKHPYMPAYTIIAIVTALGELFFYRNFWEVLCVVVGIVGMLFIAIITEVVIMPLNRKISAWLSGSVRENISVMRDKWVWIHYLRTTTGVFGFFMLLLPLLSILRP